MTSQPFLDFDPAPEPLLRLRVTPEQIRKAHKPQTARVLEMLQAGPQTTHTFIAAFVARFSARIDELRDVGWLIDTEKLTAHSSRYELKGRVPFEVVEDESGLASSPSNPTRVTTTGNG